MTAKSSIQNLKLGIFVVIGTILILIASYLIGNRQNMFTRNFTVSAVFKNVNGLQVGNNVRFSGINIGTVDRLRMENDTTIYVYMKVEEKMQKFIKRNAIATIGSDGLVGSMLVNIVPGTGEAPIVEDGDQLESYSKIGTQDMLKTLNVTNENAALLTSDLLLVTQSLTQGKGTLGRLLNDTVMASDLSKTIKNLKYSSQKVNVTLDELQKAVQSLETNDNIAGVLLSDSISASKLKHIIENLEVSSEQINKVTEDLSGVVGKIKDGEGVLNLVATDTAMANQLMRTMQNIEDGTAKFNQNMEALKHNFLTRRYFKKLEKESN